MRRVAVTGSRVLPALRAPWVLEILAQYTGAEEYLSGCQTGIDVFFADAMMSLEPSAYHLLFAPNAPYDYAAVSRLQSRGAEVIHCSKPKGGRGTDAEAYIFRNQKMMRHLELLEGDAVVVCFPLKDEKSSPRSGTWATKRLAEKYGLQTEVCVLEPK